MSILKKNPAQIGGMWSAVCDKHDYNCEDYNHEREASLELCRNKLKNGLIFFHVPKTAGRWFQQFAVDVSGKERYMYINDHRSVRNLSKVNANYQAAKGAGRLTISIIRNPFDILVSMYGHRSKDGWSGGGWWGCHEYGHPRKEFLKGFPIKGISTQKCITGNNHSGARSGFRQSLFHQTYRKDGKSEADIFIRYENLDTALKLLFDENLVDSQINKIFGKSERLKDYQQYYDDTSRKAVEETYAWELEKFGYSFDGVSDDRSVIFPWEVGQCPLDL